MNNTDSNSQNNTSDFTYQLILILVPIMTTSLVGVFSWILRGYFENNNQTKIVFREKKRIHDIKRITQEIKNFYWPLFINIIRYQEYLTQYEKFKNGDFSLSTSNKKKKKSKYTTITPKLISETYFGFSSDPSSEIIESPQTGIEITSNIIFDEYKSIINDYENLMVNTLKNIKNIYEKHQTTADIDYDFLHEIVKLDSYITYVTTFNKKKHENEYIKSKIDFTKFPDKIDIIIEQKLYYMLEIIKELRCKFDTKILDLDESEIKNNDIIISKIRRKGSHFKTSLKDKINIDNFSNNSYEDDIISINNSRIFGSTNDEIDLDFELKEIKNL